MKKLLIYLSIVVLLIALLYYLNQLTQKNAMKNLVEPAQELYQTDPQNLNEATRKQLNDPDYQNIILPGELETRLKNKEDLFVYFFSPLCKYCVESTPIVNDIAGEVQVEIHQYNVLEFRQGFSQYRFDSTPTLIYFEDGVEKDRFVGGIAQEIYQQQMRAFLEKYKPSQASAGAEAS